MVEYIERENAQDGLDNIDWYHVNDKGQLLPGGKSDIETYVPFKAVEEMLTSIPAADVRPVVRGKWVRTTQPMGWRDEDCAECSVCGEDFVLDEWAMDEFTNLMHFCPNCGADMREGE